MRRFASDGISAQPRPPVVVLDQNLRSQVSRRINVTTGTEIVQSLRVATLAERMMTTPS